MIRIAAAQRLGFVLVEPIESRLAFGFERSEHGLFDRRGPGRGRRFVFRQRAAGGERGRQREK